MQFADGYPLALHETLLLPSIVPADARLYAALRLTHTVLAYLLLIGIPAQLAVALFHVHSCMTTGSDFRSMPDGQ